MILSDNHVHTSFSTDSSTPMEAQIKRAMALGLSSLCFTDHMDYRFPSRGAAPKFIFSVGDYLRTIDSLREKYPHFSIRAGVELGLKEDALPECLSLTSGVSFDYVIGSTHLVEDTDPYYPEYWEAHGEDRGIARYYKTTLENAQGSFDFDTYGHLDYILRYCPTVRSAQNQDGLRDDFCRKSFLANRDLIAEILQCLIRRGRGIELNTAGLKYGLGHPNPHEDIISLYRDLGGELIAVGSDAHEERHLAYDFSAVPSILAGCGFTHYTEFHGRQPVQIALS